MPELPTSIFASTDAPESGGNEGGGSGEPGTSSNSNPNANEDEQREPTVDAQDDRTGNQPVQNRRVFATPQSANVPLINTIGDALTFVADVFERQIIAAIESGATPNLAIYGDASARNIFYTLLPDTFQRRVFLSVASNAASWPRLRWLFGAPPYAFLGDQDAGMLRAAGISLFRSNMTYDDGNNIVNYSQFGAGQLIDESEREYRVVDPTAGENDPLPCNLEGGSSKYVQLIVRVHRRSRKERMRRLRDSTLRKTIAFPQPGEKLNLTETSRLQAIQGKKPEAATRAALQVRQVRPRGANAATAAVLAVWS